MENENELLTDDDKGKKYRNQIFTLNNYKLSEEKALMLWDKVSYIVIGREVGEKCGTPHLQCYAEFKGQITWNSLKSFNERISWRGARKATDPLFAINYCKKGTQPKEDWALNNWHSSLWGKDADIYERGEPKKQGSRNDLVTVKNRLLKGELVDDIIMEDPMMFHQYGRTMDRLQSIAFNTHERTTMTKGIWLFGDTGCGKSHQARSYDTAKNTYVWEYNGSGGGMGFQCKYTQQPVVIFEELRYQVPMDLLLRLVDKWQVAVPIKGVMSRNFTSGLVVVTSSMSPWKIYDGNDIFEGNDKNENDNIKQLLRRFTILTKSRIKNACSTNEWENYGEWTEIKCKPKF